MTIENCYAERKLRDGRPDILKARKSIDVAGAKLSEAEALEKAGFVSSALVIAYASMFHAGRAILFRDGVTEKSHYCLVAYLREKYAKEGKIEASLITMMDAFREERNETMYSLEGLKLKPGETQMAISNARKLLEAAKAIIEK